MIKMKRAKLWSASVRGNWPVWLVVGVLPLVLFFYHLARMPGGISSRELSALQASSSFHQLLLHPLFMPLGALRWVVIQVPHSGLYVYRLPSALLAIAACLMMYYILRRWYGFRTALYGSLVFVCASWLLHVGRLATNDIAYTIALPALLMVQLWLQNRQPPRYVLLFSLLTLALVLYVPGMIWFIALFLFWQRGSLRLVWQGSSKKLRGLSALLTGLMLAPLIYSMVMYFNWRIAVGFLGMPTLLPSPHNVLKRFADGLLFIAVRGTAPPDVWLNHLAILDVLLAVSFAVGFYFYVQHRQALRAKELFWLLAVALILYGLGGISSYGLVVPLLYLIAAAGIAYILQHWLGLFPKNPLARGLGTAVFFAAIAVSCIYNVRSYYVAWPHHPATQAAFRKPISGTRHNLLQ